MTSKRPPSAEHRAAQLEACEQSAEALELLEELDDNQAIALKGLHFMHAVSALVWGDWPDYPPAVDVVLDLLGRCDVPQDWRTILLISCGALEPRDSPLVLSRKAEGHLQFLWCLPSESPPALRMSFLTTEAVPTSSSEMLSEPRVSRQQLRSPY